MGAGAASPPAREDSGERGLTPHAWAASYAGPALSIGASIFLIAAGAIVRYAFTFDIEGVDREALGLILMIAGFAGLAISILYQLLATDRRSRDDEYYRPPPSGPDDPTRHMR